MENKLPGIHNVHVSIDETNGDITFLHKVMDGAVDKSYGINVAKLANLPHEVIKKANELLKEYEEKDNNTTKTKIVKQYTLDLEEDKDDELREFIKGINILNITPLEAINLLDEIKRKID